MIPIAKPFLDEAEVAAAGEAILSGWVTQGPRVRKFEEAFAEYTGAAHACATSSCTTALHLAMEALNIGAGDEVITVSHSFIATANAIHYAGAKPVFVDIDRETFNISAAKIETAITDRTRAILCVHQLGMPCDLDSILEIAGRHNLKVIEDAACAIGSEVRLDGKWQRIGQPHGDVACFSFHPRKVITTGDGGMITCKDKALHDKLSILRQHGMSVSDVTRHKANKVIFESYPVIGFNYRMTDVQAAIGIVQLGRLQEIIPRRRELAARYASGLGDISKKILQLPQEPDFARSNWQSYCVKVAPDKQIHIMQQLLDEGIATRRGVMCIHREGAYADLPGANKQLHDLSNSEYCQNAGIMLPLYPEMSDAEQDTVIESLRKAVAAGA